MKQKGFYVLAILAMMSTIGWASRRISPGTQQAQPEPVGTANDFSMDDSEGETNAMNRGLDFAVNAAHEGTPGFASDFSIKLKPIFEAKCTRCHNSGGIAARVAFKDSNDVAKFGSAIEYKIQNKSMPPWYLKNDGSCGDYQHDPTVTANEFAAIKDWLRSKTTGGVPIPSEANVVLMPPPEMGLDPADPSVVGLQMPAPYTPSPRAGEVDEYRCFVLDPAATTDRIMTSYQVIPGHKELVHHIILYTLNTAAEEAAVVDLDRRDANPGYTCFGGPGVSTAAPTIIWAPGQAVEQLPSGTGMKLPANRKSVMQIHYNIASLGRVPDQTKILMKTTSDSGTAAGQWLFVGTAFDSPMPKGMASVTRSYPYKVPADGSMFGFFPHMHRYGKSVRLESASQCLGLAERWDFAWQLNYFLAAPVEFKADETLKATCNYDTSRATSDVKFGENSSDEMCFGFVYFVAKNHQAVADQKDSPWSAQVLDSMVPETIKFSITTASANISRVGAVFISALYQDHWYYWNPDHQPAQRWVLVSDPTSAATLPEAIVAPADAVMELTATEINASAHGAQIFVGVGYGESAEGRKRDMLNFLRYTQIYVVP